MYKCPYCGKPGIGYIRKHFIGSWLPATCKVCGNKVHNDALKVVIATLPFIVCVLASTAVADAVRAYEIMGIGLLIMVLLNAFWVPLVKENAKQQELQQKIKDKKKNKKKKK